MSSSTRPAILQGLCWFIFSFSYPMADLERRKLDTIGKINLYRLLPLITTRNLACEKSNIYIFCMQKSGTLLYEVNYKLT